MVHKLEIEKGIWRNQDKELRNLQIIPDMKILQKGGKVIV